MIQQQGKVSKTTSSFLLGVSLLLVLSSFVIAAHVIRTSSGGTSFNSRNEDTSTNFNFSINSTDLSAAANITQVNITLPNSNFTFIANTNSTGSLMAPSAFTNTSSVLTWTNFTHGLVNITALGYLAFNATAAEPGIYNFSVVTTNTTTTTQMNISVTINDTTRPSAFDFAAPGYTTTGSNLSAGGLAFNLTAVDNNGMGVFANITIRLFNSTRDLVNFSSTSNGNSSHYVNFSNIAESTYYVNATVTDSFGNVNNTATVSFIVDRTAPSVSLDDTDATRTTITFSFSGTDSGTGVSGSCSLSSNDGSVNSNQVSGLDCSSSYTVTATCTDYAGNQGSQSSSFSTLACDSSGGSSSSSSGGGTSTTTWTSTFVNDAQELSAQGSVTRSLGRSERMRLKVGGAQHFVGVKSLTTTSATVEISSTPQTATLNVGESKKFDVDGDNYYDMTVTLESIAANKASVKVVAIHEAVPVPSTTTTTGQSSNASASGESTSSGSRWTMIIVVLVIIVIIAGGYYYYSLQRKKKHGY